MRLGPPVNFLKWAGLSFALILAAAFFLVQTSALLAAGNSFYVAPGGNDSNPGTINQPFRTPQRGVNAASCGDTVYLRAGTYDGGIGANQRCTSWNSPLTLRNYPGELVTLINTGAETIFGFGTKSYPTREDIYFVLQGVILDAARGSSTSACISALSVDHVRLQDLECKNAQREGIIPHGRFWELLNLNVHDNGLDTNPSHPRGHGVYLTDGNCLIDGGTYHDNGGYGIQIFDSGSITNGNNVVRNTRIYRNNLNTSNTPLTGNGGGGIVMANGTNNVLYNSIIYGNGQSNIQVNGTCLQCGVYNNTQFGGFTGLQIVDRFATGTVVRNNIFFGNVGQAISDMGTGTIMTNNLTSDPRFTNSASGDFTLQTSSPAIDAGANLSSIVISDFRGAPRPAGNGYDIGALEFGAQPPADGVLPTVSVKASH